jgi:FO synthase subunit 2
MFNININKYHKLDNIFNKINKFERIDDDELLNLLDDNENFNEIIQYAAYINKSINGNDVSYIVNRNINFTNICYLNCKFCGYKRTVNSKDSFVLTIDKIIEKINEGYNIGINEVCVTGGINPDFNPDFYFNLIKSIRAAFPELHIHAFSPQEIFELSAKTGFSFEKVFEILKDNGLNSMPGTAAEILAPETRKAICKDKISTLQWTEIIKTAHKMNIKSSATILVGHIESNADIAYHLNLIRKIQDSTSGFTEFIALPFIASKTSLKHQIKTGISADGQKILKFYAILRLYLNNFKNIQTSWPKIGTELAVQSLSCGINDFGGTLMEENITKSAGGNFGEYLSEKDIISLIKSARKNPVRRDTLYNYIQQ